LFVVYPVMVVMRRSTLRLYSQLSILNLLKKAPSSEGTLGLEKRLIQLLLHLIRRQVATQSLVVADAEEGAAFFYLDVDQFLLQEEAEVPLEDRAAHA